MRKVVVILVVMGMVLLDGKIQGQISEIKNGSFEDDGVIYDITIEAPNNWDVNIPSDNFGGWVYDDWVTEGSYNLTLYSSAYKAFEVNEIAVVSQEVYLADVNQIVFDLRLDTQSPIKPWDPSKRTAVLMIDDVVVWESNDVGSDVRGEYRNQVVDVYIDDSRGHKLSLGLRADVNETTTNIEYYTDWDFIRFNLHCDGFGFLAGDFNRDCYVDMYDFVMLAEVWRDELDPYNKYNLFHSGDKDPYSIINFRDFAVFAQSWDGEMLGLKMLTDVWLEKLELNDERNLFEGDDVYPHGVIDFFDFMSFAENWLSSSYEQGE